MPSLLDVNMVRVSCGRPHRAPMRRSPPRSLGIIPPLLSGELYMEPALPSLVTGPCPTPLMRVSLAWHTSVLVMRSQRARADFCNSWRWCECLCHMARHSPRPTPLHRSCLSPCHPPQRVSTKQARMWCEHGHRASRCHVNPRKCPSRSLDSTWRPP